MSKDSTTRANKNKAIRQQALRDQLSAQGHVQHVVDILGKVENLSGEALTSLELQKNKLVLDTKLALIKKYLPDIKMIEMTGADGGAITTDNRFVVEVVRPDA